MALAALLVFAHRSAQHSFRTVCEQRCAYRTACALAVVADHTRYDADTERPSAAAGAAVPQTSALLLAVRAGHRRLAFAADGRRKRVGSSFGAAIEVALVAGASRRCGDGGHVRERIL